MAWISGGRSWMTAYYLPEFLKYRWGKGFEE
jgi:hypothetical protein